MKKTALGIVSVLLAVCSFAGCGGSGANRHRETAVSTAALTATEREFYAYWDDPERFPISFTYGGVSYRDLRGFTAQARTERTEGAKRAVTLEYLHPDGKLKLTIEGAVYPGYDAYEWTAWFQNIGNTNSAVLSDVWAADTAFAGSLPVVKGNLGDYGGHFVPYTCEIEAGPAVFDADTGRSSEQYMPYFNLETDAGGAMIAIGWPGTWRAEFGSGAQGARFRGTGTTGLSTYLVPGEKVRTPLMAFVRYYERDEDVATNRWRRWYIDCNLPYEDAAKTRKMPAAASVGFVSDTPIGWYRGGSEFENSTTWRASYEAVKSHGLKFDYHWFDAGWYADPSGRSLPDSWWSVGTWDLDRTKWPGDTFKEYTSAMKEGLGVKGSTLWFEVERFFGSTRQLQDNYGVDPSWLLPSQGENYLVNHGNSEAADWLFQQITTAMDAAGITVYREDHNFPPAAAFRAGDVLRGDDRSGITENLHFQGKLALWDRILDWQAQTGRAGFIEMQSSGGNRQDLELLRRSVSFFRSDSDITLDPPATVSKINALNKWLPYGGVLFGRVAETDDPNPRDKYQWRSAYSSHICVPLQFQNLTDDTWELLAWGLEEFERYKSYVFYDFYELTDWKPLYDTEQWVSRMYFDPETDRGVLETFSFPDAKETWQAIRLRGVDPDKWYRLTDADGLNGATRVKGSELRAGYDIYLQPRSSSLIWIEPAEV